MIILFRHGQGTHNITRSFSCELDSKAELTDEGKEMVRKSAKKLKKDIIAFSFLVAPCDVKIYSSPLFRTKQTAEIICEVLDIDKESIIFDKNLIEVQMGSYNENPVSNFPYDIYDLSHYKEYDGESIVDVDTRVQNALKNAEILDTTIFVSHALPIRQMNKYLTGNDNKIKVGEYFIIHE